MRVGQKAQPFILIAFLFPILVALLSTSPSSVRFAVNAAGFLPSSRIRNKAIEASGTGSRSTMVSSKKNNNKSTDPVTSPPPLTESSSISEGEEINGVGRSDAKNQNGDITKKKNTKKSSLFRTLTRYVLLVLVASVALFRGIRRSCHFWVVFTPLVVKYKLTKWHAKYWKGLKDEEELYRVRYQFYKDTGDEVYRAILSLGGFIIKCGQVASNVGTGIVPAPYMAALRPLLDGVPPRSYGEMARVIEKSTGKRMEEMFDSFDPEPIGSASIAQVHRAVLKDSGSQEVVVKVRYPEVAQSMKTDFDNIMTLIKLVSPESVDDFNNNRKFHEDELDFEREAENLREIRSNMQRHGVEPELVRIPKVMNETGLCSENVLVIEFLSGVSLQRIMEEEQERMAMGLGLQLSDMKEVIAKQMMENYLDPDTSNDGTVDGKTQQHFSVHRARLLQSLGPTVASMARFVGGVKQWSRELFGGRQSSELDDTFDSRKEPRQHRPRVNLARVFQTVFYVHGLQVLRDGVVNMDPHPGNILIMPDGKLGLLDYGMVGRIKDVDRLRIAATVDALARKDKKETARLYTEGGYAVSWREGPVSDYNILHRCATFHMDKIDFSPVKTIEGRSIDVRDFLSSVAETGAPYWMEIVRRVTLSIVGAAAHGGRAMSVLPQWTPIARQVLASSSSSSALSSSSSSSSYSAASSRAATEKE